MSNEEKNGYSFLDPGDLPRANASLIFSGISLGILLLSILIAAVEEGQGGLPLGAFGLVGALLALYAFIIGMVALTRRESRYRLCVVAAITSGVMMIIWLTVFLNGVG